MPASQAWITVLLFLTSLGILLGTTSQYWLPKQCKVCRQQCWGLAQKCPHCHEWFPTGSRGLVLLIFVSLGLWALPAHAEPLRLLPCGAVHFFADPCAEESEDILPPPPS